MLIDTLTGDPVFRALVARLQQGGRLLSAEGLWGSSSPITAVLAGRSLGTPLLFVTAHLEQADEARDDMELVSSAVEVLSAFETLPGEGAASGEIASHRARLCRNLMHAERPCDVIVAPVQALMQAVPLPQTLQDDCRNVRVGEVTDFEELLVWLSGRGFARLEWVEEPGDFAVRGGIVDVFTHEHDHPLRIEFVEDRVESIRFFDVSSHRSQSGVGSVQLSGAGGAQDLQSAAAASFLEYLPGETTIFWDEPCEIQELGRTFLQRLENRGGVISVDEVFTAAENFPQVHGTRLGNHVSEPQDRFRFSVGTLQRFELQAAEAVRQLLELTRSQHVTVYCENEGQRDRLREVVLDANAEFPGSLQLSRGLLHRGFEWQAAARTFMGHHELFGRQRQQRRIRKAYASRPLETWLDLTTGDFVVHVAHGIARFKGIAPMPKGDAGKIEEYLSLEFANRATIHVPASQINLVQKYIGAGGTAPTLSKLGGSRWARTKERVQDAVGEFAEDLLRVQALREAMLGTAYPADTPWQREFEQAFIYSETEDQRRVLEEIKGDMTRPRPMDRLICGDVGYGKTELAMRAAFKVVEYGRQVALLVPTTVLAEQHYQTFRERMADYPFLVGCLSRFRSAAEQRELVQAVRKGRIDIMIGTHRLLSKDVDFANLGLAIVDEEQRFGVEHKERLKRLRESVDVLTLTATPIPRTLHLALMGVRDISVLTTPPLDRRSIVTEVRQYDPHLVRSAIIREMNRDGQVFFVHNLVHDIQSVADRLRQLVPEARVVVGHGQMKAEALEEVMLRFVRHDADVLVCTTIIESGIDIPTANTIFIDQAERYGLADLHQLRGRVGRYHHRAYCYLLLSAGRAISPVAAKRLKAIEEYSDLGAGFRIAMRDLEIRGAGNILGPEQSGHIAAVGYEMFCQLLDTTVARMTGAADEVFQPVHLELDVVAHIPKSYIRSDVARMEVYRRLAACRTTAELVQLEADLRDAFGAYPRQVQTLLDLAELRVLAQPWGIRAIVLQSPDIVFQLQDLARADAVFRPRTALVGSIRMPDPRTVHWRLPQSCLEHPTMLALLRRRLLPEVGAAVGSSPQ